MYKIFNITIDLIDSTLIIHHEYNVANVIQTYLSFINIKTSKFFYCLTNLGKIFRRNQSNNNDCLFRGEENLSRLITKSNVGL